MGDFKLKCGYLIIRGHMIFELFKLVPSGYDSYSEGKICQSEFFLQSMSHSLLFTFFPYETTTKKKIFGQTEFVEKARTNEKMYLLE